VQRTFVTELVNFDCAFIDCTHVNTTMTNAVARSYWNVVQTAVWLVGVAMVVLLVWQPEIGLHAFWNVLIPVAPALLVIAPGVWRNICPIATTALFARKSSRVGGRRKLSAAANNRLLLAGVGLLFLIIPLRHVMFDRHGPGTALLLVLVTSTAVLLCLRYEWKSSWCSGLCPVHPVEKLYGTKPLASPKNAHCQSCERCVDVCADSSQRLDPLTAANGSRTRGYAGLLMFGFFPGYIYGWFQVPDYRLSEGWQHLWIAYGTAISPGLITLGAFLSARLVVSRKHESTLNRLFAASAVACYYWFRLPALFGFGPIPTDGMLLDLTSALPTWWVTVSRALTTGFFFWWLLRRPEVYHSWSVRPEFSARQRSAEPTL
jgi:ferredoxin